MRRPVRSIAAGVLGAALVAAAFAGSPPAGAAPTGQGPGAAALDGAVDALRAHAVALGFAGDGKGAHGLGERHRVQVVDVIVEPDGATHVRMDRSFAGLPVIGGDFVVHRTAAGGWAGVSATFTRALDSVDLDPGLDAGAALARLAVGADPVRATLRGAPRLVIDTVGGPAAAAWEIPTAGVQADGTPSRLLTYLDATTGRIRWANETVHNAAGEDPIAGAAKAPEGHGQALYLGRVPLRTSLLDGLFALKDLTRGGAYTSDAENAQDNCLPIGLSLCVSNAPATVFTDDDNQWGNGSNSDRQSAAVDAQYGSDLTWDYYKLTHNRSGIGNDGLGVYSRVHYGQRYANAFWSEECFCMTFGDGDGKVLGPLVSLDITGHEITHGVTQRSARLYNAGEVGGINEATSDIFGTMIEFFANNPKDVPDYLIGETSYVQRLDSEGLPNAIRYMDTPSRDKASPDCYHNQVDQLGEHLAAAPADHFFYLLAEGSGPKQINGLRYDSESCNGKDLVGIGREAAAKIWYRALTMYFTSNTGYAAARAAVVRAATDLHGAGSPQLAAVNAAWDGVNVHHEDSAPSALL